MATNNAYNRKIKTKREEYEEKLKQRNENDQWIFGNTFGKPGGGAPLRDKSGNVVSHLKTISNGNIFKYDAQEFTKGENNIYSINHQIFEKNNNENVNNMISDPFTPFRNYINQFEPNNNINNINNNNNQGYLIPDNNITINNNNINQNPYLLQLPDGNYGILVSYPMTQPLPNNNFNNLNNINYPMDNININNYSNENTKQEMPITIQQQRPYSSNNINNMANINDTNINTNNNNNIQNISNSDININNNNTTNYNNNLNNTSFSKMNYNTAPRKFLKKIPESTLFNEAAQERLKLEKERKNDLWKKELLEQIKDKKRREERNKRELEEKERKDELENDKFMKYKKKQREDHAKKIKEEQEKKIRERMQNNQTQSVANILDLSNNIEQANKSMMSNNNITFREGNLNDLSQQNININNNENEENNNNMNNNIQILNNYNLDNNNYNNSLYNPAQENFKNEINRQYNLLNETLNHDINREMKRISKELESNYTPFTQKLLLMNTYSKSRADLTMEQNRKIKKIENMIEDKKLVDYILGKRARPQTPKDEEDGLKSEMPIPSYFGINRDKAENKYLGLHSKSSFVNKGDNISNFIASGRNQEIGSANYASFGQNLEEKKKVNDMYNFAIKNDIDLNYINSYYNNDSHKMNTNTGKGTFGTNIQNDENLGGVVNASQNLDNISVFIPLNKDREKINSYNDKRIRPLSINENRIIRDKDMENMLKDLDQIYELTNKIDPTSKARNISDKFDGELTNLQKKENGATEYLGKIDDNINNYNDLNNKINTDKNLKEADRITEEPSKYSKASSYKSKPKSNNSNKNISNNDNNNIPIDNEDNNNNEENNNNEDNDQNKNSEKISTYSNQIKESKENEKNTNKNMLSKESYVSSDLRSDNDNLEDNDKEESNNNINKKPNLLNLRSNPSIIPPEPEIVESNNKKKTEEAEEEDEDDEEEGENNEQ